MKSMKNVLVKLIVFLLIFGYGEFLFAENVRADESGADDAIVLDVSTQTDAEFPDEELKEPTEITAPEQSGPADIAESEETVSVKDEDTAEAEITEPEIPAGAEAETTADEESETPAETEPVKAAVSEAVNEETAIIGGETIAVAEAPKEGKADIETKVEEAAPVEMKGEQVVTAFEIDIPANPIVTVYNGIDYSKVYSYEFYIEHNPDVLKVFNGDPYLTLKHFVEYGMRERRVASDKFDVQSYCNRYLDLRSAYLNDAAKYYLHYIAFGWKEGRKATGDIKRKGTITALGGQDYSDVYNYNYYISKYPDIKKFVKTKLAPDAAALEHFVTYGMNERRQASKKFDVQSYSNEYQDLRLAYGQDAKKYYMHYITYGKKEGRVATGVNELKKPVSTKNGKDYSRVYNYKYYTAKYADIKKFVSTKLAPDVAALDHFITYGMREKRQASKKFDVNSYYRTYQDLRIAYHNDYPKYYEHYIRYGFNEKRKATGEKKLRNPVTEYRGIEFGSIYSYEYYTKKYKDIKKAYGDDDIETLHHFIKWGMNEGRRGKASYNQKEFNRLKTEAKYIVAEEKAEQYLYSLDRLLKNALLPIGQTMYVWGGGWNEEDTGAGVEAVTIGVSPRWKEFADKQNSSYNYNNTRYQIHDGLDCTGYIGWMVYNTFNDKSGGEGYVSEEPEKIFLSKGWGTTVDTNKPKPGDICSTDTHVWMSLGCCADGSILIAHASPPGCYICGTLLPDGSRSQAVVLAESIMSSKYPEWYRRYPDCSRSYSYITDASVFHWNSSTLADPNNLQNMSANEIVEYLFH